MIEVSYISSLTEGETGASGYREKSRDHVGIHLAMAKNLRSCIECCCCLRQKKWMSIHCLPSSAFLKCDCFHITAVLEG
jgi:hypothetical protein